jgi:hypothetical protein
MSRLSPHLVSRVSERAQKLGPPLNCGVLADEQCCLAGVPDDREQSDAVVMSAGQYPGYGAH